MLSFDIQVEIIKRLPVKSLIQFRSVCKGWKSLIDSSHFIVGYKAQAQHVMLSYEVGGGHDDEENKVKYEYVSSSDDDDDDDENKVKYEYVSFVDDDDDSFSPQKFSLVVPPLLQENLTKIIGSSHGLLCLTFYFWEPVVLLWNPTIRKSIVVVVPDNIDYHLFSDVVGFGVCPDTMDPKLVRIAYISNHREMESISCIPCQVMVFTLSSGEWTTPSCINLPRKSIGFKYSQTVIGQIIYWLAFDWIPVDREFRNLIMSFDMSTEEFTEIDLPDSLAEVFEDDEDLSVYRLRESLAVVENGIGNWKGVFYVWMMDHGDSKAFTKLFTIDPPDAMVAQTLGFSKSGEPMVELAAYGPRSNHIRIYEKGYALIGSSYMESLLLLDYDDGHVYDDGHIYDDGVELSRGDF